MTIAPGRLLAEYGMVGVLILLCVFFGFMTVSEQSPVGTDAAQQIRKRVSDLGNAPTVLIAVADQPVEVAFAGALRMELERAGAAVVGEAKGEPREARRELERLAKEGGTLDAIACTRESSTWLLFRDLRTDFPSLGEPRIIAPRTYRWPNFLKSENLLNIANQIAVIAILAVGMTIVIITGGIDLSVGSLLALSAVVATRLIRDSAGGPSATAVGMTASCVAAIALCGAIGMLSGLIITWFRIPPFIVTLGMMLVGSGLAFTLADGQSIYQVPETFVWLGRGTNLFELPNAVLLMLTLYVVAHFLMTRTILGRHFYAVGGNRTAAWLSGVRVERVVTTAYLISGLLAGLGGVIMASQLKSGSPTYGNMYELYVIAAVVVGGASLSGGAGRMLSTLLGAFTIAVIQNGMNLTNVESYTQKIVLGLLILIAVMLDQFRRRHAARTAEG